MAMKLSHLFARVFPLLIASSPNLFAQKNPDSASETVAKARSLYYTPVDQGLRSFRCDIGFDWKTFLQKASNQTVQENDPRLVYLQTIRLSVEDELRGRGALHWNAPTPPPDGTEDSVNNIREGMEQIWEGFFQAWSGFYTGDLVTLDANATVSESTDGFRVLMRTTTGTAEAIFDHQLILRSVHVVTPTLESSTKPVFSAGPHGLLTSSLISSYRQPPANLLTQIKMDLSYRPVGSFELPSSLRVVVTPANFDFSLTNCTTQSHLGTR